MEEKGKEILKGGKNRGRQIDKENERRFTTGWSEVLNNAWVRVYICPHGSVQGS